MKNYFGFTLTGKKLLPIWLIFYILVLVPYVVLVTTMKFNQTTTAQAGMILICSCLILLITLLITFYLAKLVIENIRYKESSIIFNGKFGEFIKLLVVGIVFSIFTLGIYLAWFIRDLHRFFVNNSTLENESFTFRGEGIRLFTIYLLTVFLPIIILTMIMINVMMANPEQMSSYRVIQQVILGIIMIPYMYLSYRWVVNIKYKNYIIKWETKFWNSCGKIALELLLSVITIGIYFPMASLKLYKYFIERTVVKSGEIKRKFGFEADNKNDFLFIWGQLLLTIITLGIYYPWFICKLGTKILDRTYLE
jgi:uncharacterized membrane protein YjgN (DUF898 family)